MSNHLHVVLKTPEPNLARGMQGFLWILGSQKFVDRVKALVNNEPRRDGRRDSRRMRGLSIAQVSEVVCAEYEIEQSELSGRGSRHPARAAMAYLARRHTAATNAELMAVLERSTSDGSVRSWCDQLGTPTDEEIRRVDSEMSGGMVKSWEFRILIGDNSFNHGMRRTTRKRIGGY